MTARTLTLKGSDAGRYYVERELGYYLDQSEPPGQWLGGGAARLGLRGAVDEDDFLALMGGLDPRSGQLLGTGHTETTTRGFDVTCSAPKSVSVLFAFGDEDARAQVLAAHDAAVSAVVGWIEDHAHCRYRVNGEVCVFDAEGIVVAAFRQHSSRALDPQLHTHVIIPNRVLSPDGRWLALDARTIKQDQQTLSRLYHAGLRSELTARLGVRWKTPKNGIAEIRDVPDTVLEEFSQRSEAIGDRIEAKVDRFIDQFDRLPTPRERWRLEREAVLDTRPPKQDADPRSLHDEWSNRLIDLGCSSKRLVHGALSRQQGVAHIDEPTRDEMAEDALAVLASKQSTWRLAEVVRELAAAVPTDLAVPASELGRFLDSLAEELTVSNMVDLSRPVPAGTTRRRDGRPVTEGAAERILTTPEILSQEERLLALAERRLAAGGDDHQVEAVELLAPAQRTLATAAAGDRPLVLAVGPAGTGKTTALRPAVDQLRSEGRAVFGVAPSAAAAEALRVDAGVDADTLDKLLIEHHLDRPPDHRYDLPAGSTVIVDEAAMVSTDRLAELFDLAERRTWRLVLVGDPLQFSAVGRAGMFGHLVETFEAIELGRVHRFNEAWEASASLRLRRGDVTVLDDYEHHGRLRGGTERRMRIAAVEAWWQARERGESAALTASTNASVVALNHEAQRRRLQAGQLDCAGPSVQVGPYELHPGDVVATRHNDRRLLTDRHQMVKNRDRWVITDVHPDRSLTVEGRTGRVHLPSDYVKDHVQLAYAETSHASQGRTVDRSFLFLDGPAGAAGVYVPMTRGRESNEAFIVVRGEESPTDVLTDALSRTWTDRPAVAVRADRPLPRSQQDSDGSSGRPLEAGELRSLMNRVAALDWEIGLARSGVPMARHQVDELARRRAHLERSVRDLEAGLRTAKATEERLDRPLSRRRYQDELRRCRAEVKWIPYALARDQDELATVAVREVVARKKLVRAEAAVTRVPQLEAEQTVVLYALAADAGARANLPTALLPTTVRAAVGERPAAGGPLGLWEDAAGRLAQHHAAFESPSTTVDRQQFRSFDDPYEVSNRAAVQALERLDRALGRQPEVEPPHRSLGLSL